MSVVADACDRILECLQQLKQWDAQRFQPGLSSQEIEEKSKELVFPLPQEVYELYQWRNGNPWSNCFIFANYWMLSLENAMDAYDRVYQRLLSSLRLIIFLTIIPELLT